VQGWLHQLYAALESAAAAGHAVAVLFIDLDGCRQRHVPGEEDSLFHA
jgi:hypothetical protein